MLDSKQSLKIEETGKSLTDKTVQLGERIENDHASLADAIALLEQTNIQQCAEIDAKFSEKATAQDIRVRELTNMVHSHHGHFTDVCSTLDNKFAEKDAAQDAVIVSDRDHFTTVCQQLDDKIEQISQGLGQTIADVDASHTARSDTLFAEMSQQTGQLSAQNANLGKQLGASVEALGTELAQTDQRLSATCVALDSRISDASNEHSAKTAELESHFTEALQKMQEISQDEVAEVAQGLTDVCSKMNQKFTDKNSEQDEALESALQRIMGECTRLDR